MMPQNVLSSTAITAGFMPPRNILKEPLVDYALGGRALNDASAGLQVYTWRGQYIDGEIVLDVPGQVVPLTLLAVDEVTEFQFTFDQNMQPFVTYVVDEEAFYRWFDPTVPGFVTDALPAGSITPRCVLDDPRALAGTLLGLSDVILAYIRADSLYVRAQRDRFEVEYELSSDLAGAELEQIGMNGLRRLQFRLKGGPTQTPAPIPIERILAAICGRSGIAAFDAAEHETNYVDGYAIGRETNGRGAMEPLRTVGLFDIVESDVDIRFPARGKAPVATLTEADLGVALEGEELPPAVTTRKLQDVELPRQIRLRYPSLERDYEISEVLSPSRFGTVGVNDVSVEVAVVLSDQRATQLAEIMFRDAWVSRWSHEFTLDASWYGLEPADVVLLPVDGSLQRVRIGAFNDAGLLLRRASAIRDDDGAYVSQAIAAAPLQPPPAVHLLGETEATFLDLPALREQDNDAGFYVIAQRTGTGTAWPGARLHRSVDDGATYSQIAALAAQAVTGTVVSAPASGDGFTWNDGIYTVDILSGQLESRTEQAVLAGANAAAVGAHGRWHVFQFAQAELLEPGRYRLTRLLLGRRGTEHLIGSVVPGDAFVLVSGAGVYRTPLQSSELGVSRLYRPVTNGAPFATGEDVAFAGAGQALETFSPVRVRGARDGSDNLTISWLRRDRLSQTLRDGVAVPMSEAVEAYEVEVLDEYGAVLRTLASATASVGYSAADQTTDFGAPQAAVEVRIYQLSAEVGRGVPAEAVV